MCKTPELAVEVTLQPVRRFDLDAAIIFSDILLPLECMGIGLEFSDGEGPVLRNPLRTALDVERMREIDPEKDLGYVLKALEMARSELDGMVPLIGFAGAPFTLASYAIEGGGSRNYIETKTMMYTEPASFHLLMEKLTDDGHLIPERPDQTRRPGCPGVRQLGGHLILYRLRNIRPAPYEETPCLS